MPRPFLVRHGIARIALRAVRWKTVGEVPSRGILVGAPHTSNWDWVLTMLLAWDSRVQIRLLVKESFFKGPLAPVMRWTGAVELDRDDPGGTIRQLLADAEKDETFLLGIAAEGTRSKGDYWKSGFYRISKQTGIPITLAFIDKQSRTVGWGPTFAPTGDVGADMDRIRAFYADKSGLKPELATEPRLKEEDGAGGGTRTPTP
jgi:1-acyl-sn-glycerol-3-phosphate acyltransferase